MKTKGKRQRSPERNLGGGGSLVKRVWARAVAFGGCDERHPISTLVMLRQRVLVGVVDQYPIYGSGRIRKIKS
jgi:hypothetical protein